MENEKQNQINILQNKLNNLENKLINNTSNIKFKINKKSENIFSQQNFKSQISENLKNDYNNNLNQINCLKIIQSNQIKT